MTLRGKPFIASIFEAGVAAFILTIRHAGEAIPFGLA